MAASVAVPARLTSCHITPEEVLMNGLSCKADGIAGGKPYHYPVLTGCSYKVLRAHPDTLLSAPLLPAAQFKYSSCLFLCIPFLSIHLVNKNLSHLIWWTPLSPANSTRPWLPRAKQRNSATSRLCNTCFQKASISMWRLRPPLPCTWRRPPLSHDTLRRPNVSV